MRTSIVIMPSELAVSRLQQCATALNEASGAHRLRHSIWLSRMAEIRLLHAAEAAHAALYTILIVVVKSRGSDNVLQKKKNKIIGKELSPGLIKDIKVKSFSNLIEENKENINVDKEKENLIESLSRIRNSLQHPIAGPMGFDVDGLNELISGIEVAVTLCMQLWDQSSASMLINAEVAHDEAALVSKVILELCATWRSNY